MLRRWVLYLLFSSVAAILHQSSAVSQPEPLLARRASGRKQLLSNDVISFMQMAHSTRHVPGPPGHGSQKAKKAMHPDRFQQIQILTHSNASEAILALNASKPVTGLSDERVAPDTVPANHTGAPLTATRAQRTPQHGPAYKTITFQSRQAVGVMSLRNGTVTSVSDGTRAARAGVQPGWVEVKVNDQRVRNNSHKLVAEAKRSGPDFDITFHTGPLPKGWQVQQEKGSGRNARSWSRGEEKQGVPRVREEF
mmetsp:Transcript_52543/g.119686  ORF Transcript_52543/g.119686 Transcript_52543/m.119686 type:complete len:252 (+) Transcript_52543:523-1278(+)